MTRVVENLVTKTTLDTSGLAAGAQQAVAIFNQLGNTIGRVQGLVLPGIAGLGAAFGSRAALNSFKGYSETGDDGMAMRAKGAKEYEEALDAAHTAAGHLAAVIGQALAPNATSAAEAFATIAGWVENITIKTIDFYKGAVSGIVDWINSWTTGFGTVGDIWESIVSAIDTGLSYAIAIAQNWRGVLEVAFLGAQLAVVTFANTTVHFITEVIPKSLMWFADNWRDVFTTIGSYTKAVFTNLGDNIGRFFYEVYDALSGGDFDFKWKSLTDGAESALKSLPDIAAREMGPFEKSLNDQLDKALGSTGRKIARDADINKGAFSAGLGAFTATVKDFFTTPKAGGNLALEPAGGGASSDKFVGALQFGSKEAYSAIIKATGGGNDVQQRQLDALQAIRDNTKSKPKKASISN